MKKNILTICLLLAVLSNSFAQQEKGIMGSNNWLSYWTEFKPGVKEYGEPTQILSGNIKKNTTLYKKDIYLLLGDVFVTDSATLTIEAGTRILGDFKSKGSLTIANGSKIMAEGEQTDPIIFTSNKGAKKKGDWGGLFILGDAPTNKTEVSSVINYGLRSSSNDIISYGGENANSNSGVLRYVRIEYAGKRTKDHGYFNGLTLAGVGNETQIDNIMVSYCGGNAVSVIGGEVTMKKMVSLRSSGNDYKFNWGTQARIENSLAIRSPYISGVDGSKSIYVAANDKDGSVDNSKKATSVIAKNLTLLNSSEDLQADINVGLVKEAIYIADGSSLSMNKSVISGFNPAVIIDNKTIINDKSLSKIQFTKMYFNNCNGNIFTKYNSDNEDLENWYGNAGFFNVYSKGPDTETFISPDDSKKPDYRLRINKILAAQDRN